MTQSIDDDERTNSMGLFNTADAFKLASKTLGSANIKHGHADKPQRFLYYHALELYLKALLRQKHNVEFVRNLRHNIARLVREAETLGLVCTAEDREVFAIMADTDAIIEERYIRTGSKRLPTFDALPHV